MLPAGPLCRARTCEIALSWCFLCPLGWSSVLVNQPDAGPWHDPECERPLAAYRAAELAIMRWNFSGPGEPYPQLRRAFVYKEKPLRTPPHLTRDPTGPGGSGLRLSSQSSSVAAC